MKHLITSCLVLVLLLIALHVDSFVAPDDTTVDDGSCTTNATVDDGSCNDSYISSLEQARNLKPPIPQATKYAGKSAFVLFCCVNSCV